MYLETAKPVAESLGQGIYEIRQSTISRDTAGGITRQQSVNQEYDLLVRPEALMNIPREEAIIITPHQGAKRTAIHVFKPRLAVEGKEPYREPNEPFASTLTIWQKRGRYKQAAVSPPSAKVKAGEEKFLAAHESGGAAQNRAPSHKPTRAERNAHLQPQPKKQAKRKQDIDPEAK